MPLQDLPTEVLVNIFGWSDRFRTATALNATSRRLRSVWLEHTEVILREITHTILPLPREANLLVERYLEIDEHQHEAFQIVPPGGDGTKDAIRRARLIADELRMMQHLVEEGMSTHEEVVKYMDFPSTLPYVILGQPETFLKQAYLAVIFIVSQVSLDFLKSPISLPRKVFQKVRVGDLRLLRCIVPSLGEYSNYRGRLFERPTKGYGPREDLADHFGRFWPEDRHDKHRKPFQKLECFLSNVLNRIAWDGYRKSAEHDDRCLRLKYGDPLLEDWVSQVEDCEVEDVLASTSFCTLEGDRWVFDGMLWVV